MSRDCDVKLLTCTTRQNLQQAPRGNIGEGRVSLAIRNGVDDEKYWGEF